MNKKPNVIISFDFEIGWGDITNQNWKLRENNGVYTRLRPVLKNMLDEMDNCEVPVTWATVGGMITAPDKREIDHIPSDARKIVRSVLSAAQEKSFDGRDLFEMVLSARARHTFASHSYSHIPFHFRGVDDRYITTDLKLSLEALGNYGISTDQFVFPENVEGYHEALFENGIKTVRVAADNGNVSRTRYLLSALMTAPPASKTTMHESGLKQHYGSMLFNMGARRYHRLPFVCARAMRGLSRSCAQNTDLHLWAHPFNFAESRFQLHAFRVILRRIALMRDKGLITISTMKDL